MQWLWVTIFGWSLIVAAFIGAIAVALPLLVTSVLGGGAVTYGVISAAVGVGEAIGATAIAQVRIRRSGIAMYLFGALSGVSFFIYGLVPTVPGALLAGAVNGLSFTCFGVLWVTALQKNVPRRLLGRVTSVDYFGGTLLAPVARIRGRGCDHGRAHARGSPAAVDTQSGMNPAKWTGGVRLRQRRDRPAAGLDGGQK